MRGLDHDEIDAVLARCVSLTLDRPIELLGRNLELLHLRAAREVEAKGEPEHAEKLRQAAERIRQANQ